MHKEEKEMNPKKYKCLDLDGMPIKEQQRLSSEIKKYKYQAKIQYPNDRIHFIHVNQKEAIEAYVKVNKSKIIWIREI